MFRSIALERGLRLLSLTLLAVPALGLAQPPSISDDMKAAPRPVYSSKLGEAMVDVAKVCKTIVIELRYATERNFTGKQIYPMNARALLRKSVAARLNRAQDELRKQGLGLKIWDAYRPAWAHDILWRSIPNPEFVASPAYGGSFHTWGVAVDVTLVDLNGKEQRMPSDFDDFTPAAKSEYEGDNSRIAANVKALRTAMFNAGFKGMRDEWWHFYAVDSNLFSPVDLSLD